MNCLQNERKITSPALSIKFKCKVEPRDNSHKDHDLTGTPLEDDCEIDAIEEFDSLRQQEAETNSWTDKEECYSPISIDTARLVNTKHAHCYLSKLITAGKYCLLPTGSDSVRMAQFGLCVIPTMMKFAQIEHYCWNAST